MMLKLMLVSWMFSLIAASVMPPAKLGLDLSQTNIVSSSSQFRIKFVAVGGQPPYRITYPLGSLAT